MVRDMRRALGRPVRPAVLAVSLVLALLAGPTVAQEPPAGEALYLKYCSQCHGDDGSGIGHATAYLKPAPRDFTSCKYKIRHTPTGELPLDEDLTRVIEVGLPYTAMPGFSDLLSGQEIAQVVAHIKGFCEDFENPEYAPEAFEIPSPPAYSEESVKAGEQVYVETGCGACHGEIGYGDGASAPTLRDDWGVHIRPADLSMPWTFRGGGRREDIYRTMSAGFNGTPMPGFHGALEPEKIWGIVDYMLSLSGGPSKNGTSEAPYGTLLQAVGTDQAIDLDQETEALAELFAGAPPTLFPMIGQIIEPGRNFFPSASSIRAQAIYNDDEIAFRLSWHDMRAETAGSNAPDLDAPLWLAHLDEIDWATMPGGKPGTAADSGDDGGVWGDAEDEDGDIWGDAAVDEGGGDDIWGDAAVDDEGAGGDDFWGEESSEGGDDFWGEDDGGSAAAGPSGPDNEFSDAVALQFPLALPQGVRKPYFVFGDSQNPVDLWFVDLGQNGAANYVGRGSGAITPSDTGTAIEAVSRYDKGEWSVVIKRRRKGRGSITFDEGAFVPVALTVWDGFNRERGNKRGLTAWYNLYLEPLEKPDPTGPMMRAGLGVLILEILFVLLLRRRYRKTRAS